MGWLRRPETLREYSGIPEGWRGTSSLPYHIGTMGNRELITRELDRLPERDLDRLLTFLRAINRTHSEPMPALAAETALAKDWLVPEEDSAWGNL
jgi:hypothetical protein